jgi:putative ABC transport system permease protein
LFRSAGAPDRLLDQVVAAARVEAPNAVVLQSTTMTRMRDLLLLPLRAGSVAAAALGSMALFLAVLGLWGLIAYWVSRRTREIGLRIALGAGRASVLRLVAGRAFGLIGLGLLIGMTGSVLLGQLVKPLLYVAAFDPLSLSLGVGILVVAGLLASIVPAQRATAIDPMTVLRQE